MITRLAAFIFVLCQSLSLAQSTLFTEYYNSDPGKVVKCSVISLFSQLPSNGYAPIRVELTNQSTKDRVWKIETKALDDAWRQETTHQRSYTLSSEKGSDTTHLLLVPLPPAFHNARDHGNFEVRITARLLDDFSTQNNGTIATKHSDDWPTLGVSSEFGLKHSAALETELNGSRSRRSVRGTVSFGGTFKPEQLPEDVRALSGFDGLIFTPEDYRKLSSSARLAVNQWLRAGGTLIFPHSQTNDTLANLGFSDATADQKSIDVGHGKALLYNHPADSLDHKAFIKLLNTTLATTQLQNLLDSYKRKWGLLKAFGLEKFDPGFIIFILVVFAIVVGPINLFVFAKSGQRQRLFITTPIISLITSLLLIFIIVFQDGFGGRGMRVALIETGTEGEPYAAVTQEQICRTGVLLSNSFELPRAITINPVVLPISDWAMISDQNRGIGQSYFQEPNDSGILHKGSFFKSRAELGHQLRGVIPNRERITLVEASPIPSLSSSFSYPLDLIYYIDSTNNYWKAENLKPGQTVKMVSCDANELSKSPFHSTVSKLSKLCRKRAMQTYSRKEGFVALATKAPGIDSLSSIDWESTETIITGTVAQTLQP